ncbi:PHP domain-containing protein [Clostridium cylindrosporum]|uniref:Putative phosphatase n=1 Tax=Clostridium cylindrosporum DSM 605 TaxID=1121307 RepID=A0A0J8D4I1_CLOCY|nr:PHP domain-containing protein [Clostridium cylindrosporum]KMT21070.1 putative phosphatase [Clostridium cylindrosporum DSM 605]
MRIFGDYHTHTIYSHGKGTIEDNVKVAISKGLREIVISDHGPGHFLFGVKSSNLPIMRKEIDRLQKKYKDINIMLGVEANIISLDGDIDVSNEDLKLLDKLLVGFHYGAFGKTILDNHALFIRPRIGKLLKGLKNSNIINVTRAVVNSIERYKIDILTHPGDKTPVCISPIANAAKKYGTFLEINAGHGHLTVDDAKIALNEGANFIINSDAHKPSDVGNVDRAINIAIEAGIPIDRIVNVEE